MSKRQIVEMLMKRTALAPLAGLAILVAGISAPGTADARSVCTGVVPYNGDLKVCHTQIQEGTKARKIKHSREGNTYFFWFGRNVVTARCLTPSAIALAAFHDGDNLACPLLNRVKAALE